MASRQKSFRKLSCTEGELIEVTRRKKSVDAASKDEKAAFYAQLKGYAQTRGYSNGWVAHKFREKFGVWPNRYKDVPSMPPTAKILSWIKSRQIAWAKSRQHHHADQITA